MGYTTNSWQFAKGLGVQRSRQITYFPISEGCAPIGSYGLKPRGVAVTQDGQWLILQMWTFLLWVKFCKRKVAWIADNRECQPKNTLDFFLHVRPITMPWSAPCGPHSSKPCDIFLHLLLTFSDSHPSFPPSPVLVGECFTQLTSVEPQFYEGMAVPHFKKDP